jgi:hypothetical protein
MNSTDEPMNSTDEPMNSTEALLTGALDAAAETVRPAELRPLRRGHKRRPYPWLAPVAAAVAVVLVVAVALTVTRGPSPRPVMAAPAEPTKPSYYAELEGRSSLTQVVVRSTATGAVVTRIANPAGLHPVSVAAAAGDRTFYLVYLSNAGGLRIYRFELGAPAIPTLAAKGLLLDALDIDGSAVSPDGSQLALAAAESNPSSQPKIIIVNLRTGTYRTWSGGLARPGLVTGLTSLSWTADGRSLVYLAKWCLAAGPGPGLNCTVGTNDAQVRELNAGSGGGRLGTGPVLFRQPATTYYIANASNQYLAQALINPAGTEIIAVVQSSLYVYVTEISVATGRLVRVLYRMKLTGGPMLHDSWDLASDSTGKYLMFGLGGAGIVHGWIQSGQLHPLSPHAYWKAFTW